MLAFFSAELPSGQIVHGRKLMVGPRGKRWIAMPATMRRGSDDELVLDDRGKPIYDRIIEFRDQATRDRFADMVLAALRRSNPELFEEAGEP